MESEPLVLESAQFLEGGRHIRGGAGHGGTEAVTAQTAQQPAGQTATPADTPYPKLSIITPYSPQKLAFAAQAGYEGVVVTPGPDFNPDLSDSAIDRILAAARNAGIRIVSIEYFGPNHIDPDAGKRAAANAEFVRALEFCHRLGCKFVGTFSGGMPGASMEDQAKAFADVFNEKYLPVCEKLDVKMGWENHPNGGNFASAPAAMQAVFNLVPSKRLGLEFDPSHFVRQYIDPISAALAVQRPHPRRACQGYRDHPAGAAAGGHCRARMVALPHPGPGHRELAGVPHRAAAGPVPWRDCRGARGRVLGCTA